VADRHRLTSDLELEQRLHELGIQLEYPPTPDLARTVRARLSARTPRRWWAPTSFFAQTRWRVAAVAAAVVVVGAGLTLATPAGRSAVAERLGLRGVTITYVATQPVGTPVPLGYALALGDRVTPGEAQSRVAFPILAPELSRFGLPDAVYVGDSPPGGQVSLVYGERAGLPETSVSGVGMLLTQFRAVVEPAFITKLLGPGTRAEPVMVNGGFGYWIEGAPHGFLYRDADGRIQEDRFRLAGNTLLWQQGGLTLRLESSLTKEEALAIAQRIGPIGKK
jgi:hypothetical protein